LPESIYAYIDQTVKPWLSQYVKVKELPEEPVIEEEVNGASSEPEKAEGEVKRK